MEVGGVCGWLGGGEDNEEVRFRVKVLGFRM